MHLSFIAIVVVVVVDSHIQCIVLATEDNKSAIIDLSNAVDL